MNVLIADGLSKAGIALLKAQPSLNTIVSNPKEYQQHLGEADARRRGHWHSKAAVSWHA